MGFIRESLTTLGLVGILYSNLYSQEYPKGLPDSLRPTKSASEESQDKNKNGFRDEFELKIPYKVDSKEVIFNAYLVEEQVFEKPAVGWYINGGEIKDIFMYSDLCRMASINLYVRDLKKQGTIKLLEEKKEIYEKINKILEAKKGFENIAQMLGKYTFAEFGIPSIPPSISNFGLDTFENLKKSRFDPNYAVSILKRNLQDPINKGKDYNEEDVMEILKEYPFEIKTYDHSGLERLIKIVGVYGNSKSASFLNLKDCLLVEKCLESMISAEAHLAYINEIFSNEAGTFKKALKNIIEEMVKGGSGIDVDRLTSIVGLKGKYQRGLDKKAKVIADWAQALWQIETTYEIRTNSNAIRIAKLIGIKQLSAEETFKEFLRKYQNKSPTAETMMLFEPIRKTDNEFLYETSFKETDKLKVFNPSEGFIFYRLKGQVNYHNPNTYEDRKDRNNMDTSFGIFVGRLRNDQPYRVLTAGFINEEKEPPKSALEDMVKLVTEYLEIEAKLYK